MRANTITVTFGVDSPKIIGMDYLQSVAGIQVVPLGGATVLVEETMNDVNNTDGIVPAPTIAWFAMPTPLNVAVTANQQAALSLFPVRFLRVTVTVAGKAEITILQASGGDGLG